MRVYLKMLTNQKTIKYLTVCCISFILLASYLMLDSQMQQEGYSSKDGKKKPGSSENKELPECGQICTYNGSLHPQSDSRYPWLQKTIKCHNIMARMAYRGHRIAYPPPRYTPEALLDGFTQYGEAPIKDPIYKVDFDPQKSAFHRKFTEDDIQTMKDKHLDGTNINNYHDNGCMRDTLRKYMMQITGSTGVVIGTETPWLESMLLANGATEVTTLEYGHLTLEHPQLKVYSPYSFAEMFLNNTAPEFDLAASFSSIEHSGLGRYGDPINPYGDLEAVAQIWCMVKPGGLFFLAIPASKDDSSYIRWNAHRVYGSKRFPHLTANWELVDYITQCKDKYNHALLVLAKSDSL